jgi:hypothetical protein
MPPDEYDSKADPLRSEKHHIELNPTRPSELSSERASSTHSTPPRHIFSGRSAVFRYSSAALGISLLLVIVSAIGFMAVLSTTVRHIGGQVEVASRAPMPYDCEQLTTVLNRSIDGDTTVDQMVSSIRTVADNARNPELITPINLFAAGIERGDRELMDAGLKPLGMYCVWL